MFSVQLYKQATQSVVAEFIPLIMKTLLLQPTQAARSRPTFNSELFVDFTAAQVKTLSFVAFFVRLYHVSAVNWPVTECLQRMMLFATVQNHCKNHTYTSFDCLLKSPAAFNIRRSFYEIICQRAKHYSFF